jgi:hypothetical protein
MNPPNGLFAGVPPPGPDGPFHKYYTRLAACEHRLSCLVPGYWLHLDDCPVCGCCTLQVSSQHAAATRRALAAPRAQPPSSTAAGPPPRGRALDMQHMAMVQSAWRPLLPPSATEQNKLLSRMMQQVTQGDPYAYTIFKQDGKEFMWVVTCSPCGQTCLAAAPP